MMEFPVDISIYSENPKEYDFGIAAVEALKKCRFTPGEANGKKVSVNLKLPVSFKMSK